VLDGQRLPRARLFVLADAVGVAPRVRERRHADVARSRPTQIHAHQPHGAADRRVGAPARAEHARARIDLELRADRAVHDHERRRRVGRRRDPMQVERLIADRLDRRDHDRQVLRTASGHNRVDRDLLDGGAPVVGRHERHELSTVTPRSGDGSLDEPPGRGNDREPIGHSAGEEALDRVGFQIGVDRRHAPEANTGRADRCPVDRPPISAGRRRRRSRMG